MPMSGIVRRIGVFVVLVSCIAATASAECMVREDHGWFGIDTSGGLFGDTGAILPAESGGSGMYQGMYLPYDHGEIRYVQWFYDHPFSYERYKKVFVAYVMADRLAEEDAWARMYFVHTTPFWDVGGPVPSMPPGPPEQFINGFPTYSTTLVASYTKSRHGSALGGCWDYVIPEYNPVWVGIMLVGSNVNGGFDVRHACCDTPEIPEPGTMALLGFGAGALGFAGLRRRRRR